MSDELAKLDQDAQSLLHQSVGDHIINLAKAGLNGVPFGGCFTSFMSDYIPTEKGKRLVAFSIDLVAQLKRLEDKINADYIKTEEFAYLFTRAYENVSKDYQKTKLRAYRNILLNALCVDIDANIKESYLYRVENLTALHLWFLNAFDPSHEDKRAEIYKSFGHKNATLREVMLMLLPGFPEDQLMMVVHDLDTQMITDKLSSSINGSLGTPTSPQYDQLLTPYGRGFLDFIADVE